MVRVGNAQYGTARVLGAVLVVVRVGNAQYGTARALGVGSRGKDMGLGRGCQG